MRARAICGIMLALGLLECLTCCSAVAQDEYRIAGVVVNAFGGEPVAGVKVAIGPNLGTTELQVVLTESDGRFSFEHVRAEKYLLSATKRGYGNQLYKAHAGYSSAIVIDPGLDTTHLEFRITPDSSITGDVTDESGDRVRSAQVYLFSKRLRNGILETFSQMQVGTDDEGHYHFGHVAPGTYYVGVVARVWYQQERQLIGRPRSFRDGVTDLPAGHSTIPDVVYPFTYFPKATNSAGAGQLILHGGDTQVADVVLTMAPAIHMKFDSPTNDGSQFPSVQVSQILFDNSERPFDADIEMISPGKFEIANMIPGRFKFRVEEPNAKNPVERSGEMEITDDGELSLSKDIQMTTVSGELTLSGQPQIPEDINVILRNVTRDEGFNTNVDPKGHFQFPANFLPPGKYQVFVLADGATTAPTVSVADARAHSNSFELGSGQTLHIVLGTATGAYQLSGVALRDGKPCEGVMVMLVPSGTELNPELVRFDQSDSDGTFSLYGVGSGKYTVLALEDGWDLEWAKPGVLDRYLAGGATIQVNAGLQKKIEVKVQ
jgi:hypothetical protein